MLKNNLTTIILFILFTLISGIATASEDSSSHHESSEMAENHGEHEKKFNAGEFIIHHISDAHEIHFFTLNEGTEAEKHYSISLPVIIKDETGFKMFSASHFYHNKKDIEVKGSHKHYYTHEAYVMFEEKIYKAEGESTIQFNEEGKIANESVLDLSPDLYSFFLVRI